MKKRFLGLFIVLCMISSLMTGLELTASAASSGTCGKYLTWTLDDDYGTLTISGNGDMDDYCIDSPWYLLKDNIKKVIIEKGVTSIGNYAFYDCSSLTSITIPDSVTSIGDYAFDECSSLTSITIPDSVTSIGYCAFGDCSSLTSITIPDSVTSICDFAFRGCSSLTNIIVGNNNENYSSLDGNLFDKNKTTLVQYAPGKNDTFYTIPDSVTSIGYCAFDRCSSLTNITIPDSVTSICDFAFRGCSSLTSITISDSVTNIGDYAFYECSSLTNITIPDSVTSICDSAFRGCSSLTSITISDSVTNIGDYAFGWCSSLTSITIPNSVTSIGNHAFISCSSLTSITIPDSVTSIGNFAFDGCSSLTSITIPDSVTSIGKYAFDFCNNLTDVYYSGTEEQWNKISIGLDNDCLTNATIHYNSNPDSEKTYTISYDANGGSDAPENQTKTAGEDLILSSSIPVRTGYTFLGWATSRSASTAEYQPNSKFTLDADITLYAVWKLTPYTSTTFKDAGIYKVGIISLNNIQDDCTIYISKYKDDKLVSTEIRPYTLNSENPQFFVYENQEAIDTIKIFVWKNLETLVSLTKAEVLPLTNN